ncbi:MAG: hypothetical protein RIB71_11000 [Imperialibacter sp.]|uniref:hypothetical protein n=1 Tax=Imperialibacter sp. TaxID=2038411 RepID=UPI0032EE4C70
MKNSQKIILERLVIQFLTFLTFLLSFAFFGVLGAILGYGNVFGKYFYGGEKLFILAMAFFAMLGAFRAANFFKGHIPYGDNKLKKDEDTDIKLKELESRLDEYRKKDEEYEKWRHSKILSERKQITAEIKAKSPEGK